MTLSIQQQIQEDEYIFPYHYLSLYLEEYRKLKHVPYLYQLSLIKELISPLNGESLLDIGCGDGRLCYELRYDNVKYVGLDYSEQAIRFAKAFNPLSEFHVATANKLDFKDKFDIITMIEVLEHIKPEDISKSLSEIILYLKPTGHLIISVPSINVPVSSKHYQHFNARSLEEVIPSCLKLEKIIGYIHKDLYSKFLIKLKWSRILWPLYNKLPWGNRYLKSFEEYWKTHSKCDPIDARVIIAQFGI